MPDDLLVDSVWDDFDRKEAIEIDVRKCFRVERGSSPNHAPMRILVHYASISSRDVAKALGI